MDEIETKLKDLFLEITDNDDRTLYERWLDERQQLVTKYDESYKKTVEVKIKLALIDVFKKRKGDYFDYKDILEIPEIKEHFKIITTMGDRNIGKTTSAHSLFRDDVASGKRFVELRNQQNEMIQTVISDSDPEKGYLSILGLKVEGAKDSPNIVKEDKQVVGYYRDLNAGKFKSIEFPLTRTILWEEFNSSTIGAKAKIANFIQLVTTIQRHNYDFRIIAQANYTTITDEWIQFQGYGLKTRAKSDFIHCNWLLGSIIISIPSGVYKSVGDKDNNLGYRLSLGNFDIFAKQYGGNFNDEEPVNVIDLNSLSALTPIFNMYFGKQSDLSYGSFKMTLYHGYDLQGKFHNILTTPKGPNDKPIFIYSYKDKIMYPRASLNSIDSLSSLIDAWKYGSLKTDSMEVHSKIVELFARALEKIEKSPIFVDIEEIL